MLRYDLGTGAFLGTFASGGGLTSAAGATFGPDGDLYVSDFSTRQILRYQCDTGAPLGVFASLSCGPYAVLFGPDGNAYVGCSGGSIQRLDGTTGASTGTFVSPPAGTDFGGMAFYRGSLFVTYIGPSAGSLYRYDATSGASLGALYQSFYSNGPRAPVVGQDGSIYVPEWQTQYVKKFGASYAYVGNFISDAGVSPKSVLFTPDGRLLVLHDPGSTNSVRRYNPTTGAFVETFVAVGAGGLTRAQQILLGP